MSKANNFHVLKDLSNDKVKIYRGNYADGIDFEEQFDEPLKNKVELKPEEWPSKTIDELLKDELSSRYSQDVAKLSTIILKSLKETYLPEEQKRAIMLKIYNEVTK